MGQKLKPKDNELYKRIDEVLHYIWDPIRVCEEPSARDEYYSYLPEVFSLVKAEDKKSIVDFLLDVETNRMGMSGRQENAEHVADILLNCHDRIFKVDTKHIA